MTYKMRIYYEELGGHTHIRIFTGKDGNQLGKAGDLTMTNEEFAAWRNATVRTEWLEEERKK